MEYVSTQYFMRCASKKCINSHQKHVWTILMAFEAKKPIQFNFNVGVPILHA